MDHAGGGCAICADSDFADGYGSAGQIQDFLLWDAGARSDILRCRYCIQCGGSGESGDRLWREPVSRVPVIDFLCPGNPLHL